MGEFEGRGWRQGFAIDVGKMVILGGTGNPAAGATRPATADKQRGWLGSGAAIHADALALPRLVIELVEHVLLGTTARRNSGALGFVAACARAGSV